MITTGEKGDRAVSICLWHFGALLSLINEPFSKWHKGTHAHLWCVHGIKVCFHHKSFSNINTVTALYIWFPCQFACVTACSFTFICATQILHDKCLAFSPTQTWTFQTNPTMLYHVTFPSILRLHRLPAISSVWGTLMHFFFLTFTAHYLMSYH